MTKTEALKIADAMIRKANEIAATLAPDDDEDTWNDALNRIQRLHAKAEPLLKEHAPLRL